MQVEIKCPKCDHEFEYDDDNEEPAFTKEDFEDSMRFQQASFEFMKSMHMFSADCNKYILDDK